MRRPDQQAAVVRCGGKEEKSKTHEARRLVLGDTEQLKRGRAGAAHGRMMTVLELYCADESRDKDNALAYACLGGCSGSRQRATGKYCL